MHMFGFNSFRQAIKILVGYNYKFFALMDMMIGFNLALLSMVSFIDTWVWNPAYSLFVYFILLAADFFSGVAVGMRVRNEGFLTSKGQRIIIIFPVHFILLGVLFNLGRINQDIGIPQLGEGIFIFAARGFYFYVMGINLISFAKNLALLGYLPQGAAGFLAKYVDVHKNLDLDKKESEAINKEIAEDEKIQPDGR